MSQPSLQATQERLRELTADICTRAEVPADLVEDLRQVFFALRNHAFYMEFLKRQLGEMCAEMDLL